MGLIPLLAALIVLPGASHAAANRAKTDVSATLAADWQKTLLLLQEKNDPLARKLISWLYATESALPISPSDLMAFTRENPNWPRLHLVRAKIEKGIAALPPEETTDWLTQYPPTTYEGIRAAVAALRATGKNAEAAESLRSFWRDASLNRNQTASLAAAFGSLLTPADHAARLDELIWQGRLTEAEYMLAFTGPAARAAGQARIALAKMTPNASTLVQKLPAATQAQEGVLFERLRWRRRRGMDTGALEILQQKPASPERADIWWGEMNILMRRAIEKRDYAGAYKIAAQHKMTTGSEYAQAEWMLGWLALRFLNKPADALRHFENMNAQVNAAISKSRAAYWAARAAEALKNPALAAEWEQRAATFPSTFYGQLSYRRLFGTAKTDILADPVIDTAQRAAFDQKETVRAARLLHRFEMHNFIDPFLAKLILDAQTPQEYALAAQLARETGRYYYAVQANKDIQQKHGGFLPGEGYPVLPPLPLHAPEKSLVHAIIHRESMFNTKAVSTAGALGLMQLMPRTARAIARQTGEGFTTEKLTNDPRFNILMGSTYLHELVDRYDGFYPMAIAAYNAGPGRVDGWIREFGDPRKGEMELIDWLEHIPIYETRNYVQRVMESYYMYRLRFGDTPRIVTDFLPR